MTRTPRPVDCGLRDADSKTTGQHIDFTRVSSHLRSGDLQKHVKNVSDGLDSSWVALVDGGHSGQRPEPSARQTDMWWLHDTNYAEKNIARGFA